MSALSIVFPVKIKEKIQLTLQPSPISYEVIVGEDLVEEALSFACQLASRTLVLTTAQIVEFLPKFSCEKLVLPQNEAIKSRETKEKIEDALIERGWGKESCIIAIGGGVLLDLAGFVAATYCRGIPYVSLPTTLLAMSDAAIGGKTGVNVEEAKNWIGAFHHPRRVFLDLNFLQTLPKREYVHGLSETIKHALIADEGLFCFLEEHLDAILSQDPVTLHEMICRSCTIKKAVVEEDPFELHGLRRILNFGHTVAHALETLSEYALSHGQAVVIGMLVEAHIAHRMDYLSHVALDRIHALFKRIPFHLDYPDRLPFEMLKRDKKGAHRCVMLTAIGSVAPCDGEYTILLNKELFEAAWEAACDAALCHA